AGVGVVSLSLKLVIVWMVYTLTIVATQLVAPQYSLELLTGIALATLLHTAVGLLQVYSFSQSEFPLVWLYNNPAFLSVQENAENLARYNRRPFGIFPEPSAMSASLAPWVILWASYLCGVVAGQPPGRQVVAGQQLLAGPHRLDQDRHGALRRRRRRHGPVRHGPGHVRPRDPEGRRPRRRLEHPAPLRLRDRRGRDARP